MSDKLKAAAEHLEREVDSHRALYGQSAFADGAEALARRTLAQAEAAKVPEGYVLVPIEPTQIMCQEGQWKAREWPKFPLRIVPIWKAMLAAASQERASPPTAAGQKDAI